MAKSRSKARKSPARRKNPTGTLLVNPRHGGKSRAKRVASKAGTLGGFFSKLLRKAKRKNPLVINPRKRKAASHKRAHGHKRTHGRKRNPLVLGSLVVNPRNRKAKRHVKRGHGRKRNPLLVNPGKRSVKRRTVKRNPALAFAGGLQKKAQSLIGKLPLVGGLLSGAVGVLGAALGGAVGVLPISYAMPYVGRYVKVPDMLKPYAYTLAGVILSAAVSAVGGYIPMVKDYRKQIAMGIATAGGAVDAYRWRQGKSYDLGEMGDEDMGDEDMGDEDMGDIGDDGSPLAATEYSDASLADADYIGGDDFSGEELAAIELGRRNYGQKFMRNTAQATQDAANEGGSSDHAGKPGRRFGWLIYWIGFDNVQALAKMPEAERKQAIEHMRTEAKLRARKLVTSGLTPAVQEAEVAGLLVAA